METSKRPLNNPFATLKSTLLPRYKVENGLWFEATILPPRHLAGGHKTACFHKTIYYKVTKTPSILFLNCIPTGVKFRIRWQLLSGAKNICCYYSSPSKRFIWQNKFFFIDLLSRIFIDFQCVLCSYFYFIYGPLPVALCYFYVYCLI